VPAVPTDKLERQQLLRRLLSEHALRSQAEVREVLAAHGVDAHQATVSRDLDELGAVKVRGARGDLVYRLTAEPGPSHARSRLDEVLRQFVTSVRSSGNLAVLRTPPACADPVASAIDLAELPGVLATVSGDDTVLVVAEEGIPGAELAARFLNKLNL
jgi:transcriptional regulator of arginine metabolism